jgi:hypothetical protein
MCCFHHQNAGQNRDMKPANRYFENLAQFRYLGMTVTDQNFIQEEISPQPFIFALVSKNVKIEIYKTIICLWFFVL